jgi:glycosyltransferase involved in cell wall biosynthesis
MFVARNFEAKGGGDLLTALEGLDGWELDAVTHSRVQPGPRVRVHEGLTPGCSKLSELYSRADAFVLPTRGDSSPFAVLEGMAAGLPIITTAVGALGEIVTDGSGLLVAPGNVRMLREALARILIDPQLRSRMGARARARVIQLYNADINANRLLDLVISIDRTRLRPLLSPAEPRSDAHRHDRETQLL